MIYILCVCLNLLSNKAPIIEKNSSDFENLWMEYGELLPMMKYAWTQSVYYGMTLKEFQPSLNS
jgi:hypothetical protein